MHGRPQQFLLTLNGRATSRSINRNIRLADLAFARQLGFCFGSAAGCRTTTGYRPSSRPLAARQRVLAASPSETPDADATKPCRDFAAASLRRSEGWQKNNILRPKRIHLPNLAVLFVAQSEAC